MILVASLILVAIEVLIEGSLFHIGVLLCEWLLDLTFMWTFPRSLAVACVIMIIRILKNSIKK